MRPRRDSRLIHLTRWLGLAFVAGGFAAIGLGWAGAARLDCVACQLPYLISGGFGGVALVVLGVGLLLVAQIRTERVRLLDHRRGSAATDALGGPAVHDVDAASGDRRVSASRGG